MKTSLLSAGVPQSLSKASIAIKPGNLAVLDLFPPNIYRNNLWLAKYVIMTLEVLPWACLVFLQIKPPFYQQQGVSKRFYVEHINSRDLVSYPFLFNLWYNMYSGTAL